MANRRTTFGKLERDKAKRAKQAAKRERRFDRSEDEGDEVVDVRPASSLSEDQVLERLQALHERFEAGTIDFEQFEEEKDSLMSLLTLD